MTASSGKKRSGRATTTRSLKLKPADPFELVRWLARSQSDPRKAVAELVQNSLDAGARTISIERFRRRGAVQLVIRDDGEGVIPELADREEAVSYLATHVGRSRKLGLDPGERAKRVVAGKYGVGLLGFWSIGHFFEIRSRVGGSPLHALRLEEDSPAATILRLPHRVDDPPTFTEVAVIDLHRSALNPLSGRRLSEYLAAELRGQILRTGATIEIHDRIARGSGQRQFTVTPRRFTGERLDLPDELAVEGHPAARLELYLSRGAERPSIQIAAAGTRVVDDIAELASLGLAESPWIGRELTGIIDFAGFSIPPGSRRGVVPDAAAQAFVIALGRLRPAVELELSRFDTERVTAADKNVVRDLKRALRGLHRRLPQYDLPRIGGPGGADGDGEAGPGEAVADAADDRVDDAAAESTEREAAPSLFPPGPLEAVRIKPAVVVVAPGGERRIRAVATDQSGRRLGDASFAWTLDDSAGLGIALDGEGPGPAVRAAATARLGGEAAVEVVATCGDRAARARATVRVEESDDDDATLGVPEPNLVSDADGRWRSRMQDGRWEVNDAHIDYRETRAVPRSRVRYLLSLLAMEIILRTSHDPRTATDLESMVEILAHAERNLRSPA